MKIAKLLIVSLMLLMGISSLLADLPRTVDALILPQWHQTNPWNARCPGQGPNNRANAGSHALALAKTMKYWAYPTYGTGSVSYTDDDFGPLTQNFTSEIMWDNMSNTLVFQTTQRFIYYCGVAVYTNYEYDFSTSSLANIQSAMINHFSYDSTMQYRNRADFTNFYWKSLIRTELDAARPVIYAAVLANGNEVAFIVDGYNDAGLFHINWSNVNYTDGWFDINDLSVGTESIPVNNQHMLTGIRPSQGPVNIDENFETDFSNWNWQFSGHANWTISSEAAYFGSQSAKSGNINDNQITSMYISINVTQADTISFYEKVSCEAEPNNLYDHLAFFIDNVEQERWSGDGSWAYQEYPVTPGVHVFRWTYEKDGASDYFNDCGYIDAIDLPEGTTPLAAPRFVEAEVINGNDIQIGWAPPDGTNPSLLGYKLFRNGTELVQFSNPSLTSYVDYDKPNGVYTYVVRCVFTEGISGPSNSSTVTVEIPYAPTNLTAVLQGINTGVLTWTQPPLIRDRALMGYQIYRDNVLIGQVENPEDTNYSDTGLAEGVYYYEVTAMYNAGESARSNTAMLAVGVPEPPANFHATVVGSTVNLSWSQVAQIEYLTGFKVFRNGILIATITNPAQLTYSDTGLRNGQYSYYVHAVYTDAESGNSTTATVQVEVPYPPANVYTTVNGDDVSVHWTNPESIRALTQYYIYRGGQIIAAVFNPNTTVYLDQNLANGIYNYQVSAVYSGVESPLSAIVPTLVEVLYPPTNLHAQVSLADVSLSWTIPVNSGGLRSFNGYNIYRNNVQVGSVNGSSNNHYIDVNVPNGLYTYEVTAVYTTGESTRASIGNILVEVLYPVTVLNYNVDDDDVILSWQAAATAPGRDSFGTRAFLTYDVYKEGNLLAQTTQLTYTDADLANGFYHYYVVAHYGSGDAEPSPTVTVEVQVLYPPTALLAAVTQDDVHLSWTAPVNSGGLRVFTGYKVYRDGSQIGSTTALSYDDPNLPNGTYQYSVKAAYQSGDSEPAVTTALVEVLYTPRSLAYSVTDHNDVNLSWVAPVNSGGLRAFEAYKIYRNGSFYQQTTELSFQDLDVANGHYTYYLTALYGTGESEASNTVSPFIEYPYAPSNLTAVVTGDDVNISWDVVPGTSVSYHLYRDGILRASLPTNSFIDQNLANGTYSYYLTVTNASDSGVSDPCAPVQAIVAVTYPPRNLAGMVTTDDVHLTWSLPATGPRTLLNYLVYRDGVQIGTTTGLAYDDPNLANGVYAYYVTAVYDNGESPASNVVNLTVDVHYPPSNLVYAINGDDVILSWTAAPTSAGGRAFHSYWIYRNGVNIATSTTTTYTDQNLANGTYSYFVRAAYTYGLSSPTNTVTAVIELLYPPSNLSYSTNDDAITLAWTAAPVSGGLRNFLGYRIYREGSLLATQTGLSYTDPGLSNGTYHYYVTANYTTGESTPSNTVEVLLEVLYPATGLTAQVSGDDVSLAWTAPVSSGGLRNFTGYTILRDGAEIAQTNVLTYQDLDLANGLYQYQIVAIYSSGSAIPSNVASALVEVLYAPSELVANVTGDTVGLVWTPAPISARAMLGYKIYRDRTQIGTSVSAAYADAGLANGTYEYYVTANYGTGESTPSNTVSAVVEVLYPAANLSYTVLDDDVTLSWEAAATTGGLRGFLGYDVYKDGSLLTHTAGLTYVDMNLSNGIYAYYVTAVYTSGAATPTNTVNVLVEVLYPATTLTAQVNGDDVSLAWNAAVTSGGLRNIQGYKIYREGVELAQTAGTSYIDQNLANGVYHYYVTAVYLTGVSLPTNTVEAIVEVLYPAANLSYTTNDDDIILSWEAAPTSGTRNFLGYNIYRDGSLLINVQTPGYTDASLANGIYQYYITAQYTTGESSPTNTVNALMEVLYPATNLTYLVTGDDIALSWNAAATSGGLRSFLGYKIIRDGSLVTTSLATTYNDLDLANGIYHYTVIASYGTGDAIPTPEVEVLVEVLYPASNLAYQVVADDVMLSWSPAPNSARALLGYNIYRDGQILNFTSGTTYTDSDLANGTYQYYVKAMYGTGESVASNTVTATVEVLYPASNLTYIVLDDDVTLAWLPAPTSGGLRDLIGYDVYRDDLLIGQTISLTYTDLNLSNGSYSYYVKATYSSGTSTPTNTVNVVVEVLYPATNLTAMVSVDDVTLSWTAATVSGGLRSFLGYKVYREDQELAQVTETNYHDLDLANGTYNYYVKAVYSSGLSAPTNTAVAFIEIQFAPTNLTQQVSGDDVSLVWQAAPISFRSLTGYQVYRNGSPLAITTVASYQDLNLANGTYTYFVKAIYVGGLSEPTNTVTAVVEVPYEVTALTANVVEDNVTLSWTIPVTSLPRAFQGYFIYRNNNLYQVLDNPALTSWTDYGLPNGNYSYYMVAVYDAGLSIPSNTVNVTVYVMPDLNPPTGLTATLSGERDVVLAWTAPTGLVLGYNIYRNGVQIGTTTLTSYTDLNLPNGSYDYYVKAQYAEGLSSASIGATINIMVANPPTGVAAQIVNGNDVQISWSRPDQGEIGFVVYRNGAEIGYVPDPTTLQFTDHTLPNGVYNYSVGAVYSSVFSLPSAPAQVTILIAYPPREFTLNTVQNTISLAWLSPLDTFGFQHYNVWRNGAFYQSVTDPLLTDSTLPNGTYSYYVTSVYSCGESTPTQTLTGVVGIAHAATNLSAGVTNDSIMLTWTGVPDPGGFTGYAIYRNATYLTTVAGIQYTDANLANGTYSYYLVSQYSFGNAQPSNIATATVELLYPPTALQHNVIDNDAYLTWTVPVNSGGLRNLLGFKVYREGTLIAQPTQPAYADMDLANGTYHYLVKAVYSSGDSAPTSTTTVIIEVMYPASNLTAQVTGSSVTLNWTPVPPSGATLTGYRVYRDGTLITTTTLPTYTDAALANGIYNYYVSAQYANGESLPTNTVQAVIEILYAPSALTYQIVGSDIVLTWTPAANSGRNFLGYKVIRNGTLLTTVSTPAYTDAAMPNGNYDYYVTAIYSSGESTPSNNVTVMLEVLYAPSNLTYQLTDDDVTLSWNSAPYSPRSFISYNVLRNGTQIATVGGLSYVDYNRPNGNYSYSIQAHYTTGLSQPTNVVNVNVLIAYPPTALAAQVTQNQIVLNWQPSTDLGGFSHYRIYRNGSFYQTSIVPNFTDPDLANGTYSYYVKALYGALESAASNTVSPTVEVAYSASNLSGTVILDDVLLNWTDPVDMGGFNGYSIYRDGVLIGTTFSVVYTDTNLPNGTYSYFVITNYYSGSSLPSNTYSPTVRLPYMPQNADISVINDNVMITWEAPTDTNLLTGYRVLRDGVVIFESDALFYLDQELANEDYEYTVRSVYGVAISNPANAGTAHVEVHYVPGPTQAGAYLTTVNLTWAAVSDAGFLINYRIYRDGVQIGTTNVLNYEDTGLANGTYTYSITAVYQNGESIPNTSATVTVDVAYSPNNLQANWEGNTVTLTWLPPTDMLGFVEYKVFRNGLLQNTTSALTYTDLNVSNGIQMYVVGALYANGITAPSIPAMATILVAYDPSNLSGEIQDNDILLTWSAPEDVTGLTAYNVYRDGVLSWTTTQDNTSYLLDNMPNGIYNLSVSAVYGSLESSHTPEITLGLIIAYPVPYLFTDPSDVNEIILGWNAPADTFGLTGYRIWRNGTYLTEQTERSFTDHNLPNGSYVYTLRSVYGSVISDSISTSELVIEYFPLASNVAATAITEGYRISWDAPVTATMPDHYKVFFLREQDTDNQEDWVFVAETDSLSVIDTIHGGYSHGSFIWAVFTFYDEFLAGYELSNVLVVDPAIPPVPEVTKLVGNYPNPFNPETRIVFQLKQNTPVKLQIYNDKGQLVKNLLNTDLTAGEYSIPWDGRNSDGKQVNSGLYIYKLITTGYTHSGKMMLLK